MKNPIVTNLRAWHPAERLTRLRHWALLVWSLLHARSAGLPPIASLLKRGDGIWLRLDELGWCCGQKRGLVGVRVSKQRQFGVRG